MILGHFINDVDDKSVKTKHSQRSIDDIKINPTKSSTD